MRVVSWGRRLAVSAIALLFLLHLFLLRESFRSKSPDNVAKPSQQGVSHHFVLIYDQIPSSALCAVESLSKLTDTVHVWVKHPDQRIPFSVTTHVINMTEIFLDTPLLGFIFPGNYSTYNVANGLRLAIVYKYGGVYMDTDFLVYKVPGIALPPGYAKEDGILTNSAIFRFDQGSPLAFELMRRFVLEYKGDVWGHQGAKLFTRTINDWPSPLLHWNPMLVYPYLYRQTELFFLARDLPLDDDVVAVHLWSSFSESRERRILCSKRYELSWLARERASLCPVTFAEMMQPCPERRLIRNNRNLGIGE